MKSADAPQSEVQEPPTGQIEVIKPCQRPKLPRTIQCPDCQRMFGTERNLNRHRWDKHGR